MGGKPEGKFVYRCGGTEIALFPKPEGTKAEHTSLSFRVGNIAEAIALLKSRGVTFADYDFPGLKTIGHVCVGSKTPKATSCAGTKTRSERQ